VIDGENGQRRAYGPSAEGNVSIWCPVYDSDDLTDDMKANNAYALKPIYEDLIERADKNQRQFSHVVMDSVDMLQEMLEPVVRAKSTGQSFWGNLGDEVYRHIGALDLKGYGWTAICHQHWETLSGGGGVGPQKNKPKDDESLPAHLRASISPKACRLISHQADCILEARRSGTQWDSNHRKTVPRYTVAVRTSDRRPPELQLMSPLWDGENEITVSTSGGFETVIKPLVAAMNRRVAGVLQKTPTT
jgi:hypothetical protein